METKGEEEKEKLVEMLYSLIKDDTDEDSPNKNKIRDPSPNISKYSRSDSDSSRSSKSLRSSKSSRSLRSSTSSRSSRSRSRSRSRLKYSSDTSDSDKETVKHSSKDSATKLSDNGDDSKQTQSPKTVENEKSRTPSPVAVPDIAVADDVDLSIILEACSPIPSPTVDQKDPTETEKKTSLPAWPATQPLNILLPNFKYKPKHVLHPAFGDLHLHPVFSVTQLVLSHPTFCKIDSNHTDTIPADNNHTDSTTRDTSPGQVVRLTNSNRKGKKSKKFKSSPADTHPHPGHPSPSPSDQSDKSDNISHKSCKKVKKPAIAAAKRKSGKSSAGHMKVSTAFSSSEESDGKVEQEEKEVQEEKVEEDMEVKEESEVEEAEIQPVMRKVDVSMERLHKNIVEHKHGQYKRWVDKEEERKEREGRGRSGGSEGGSDSEEEEVSLSKRKVMKKTKKINKETKSNPNPSPPLTQQLQTPPRSPPHQLQSNSSPEVKKSSPAGPQVFANPFFDSTSSSSEDEKDKEQLVEMLFSLINEDTQAATNVPSKQSEAFQMSEDEDFPQPVPAHSGPDEDLPLPGDEDDLPLPVPAVPAEVSLPGRGLEELPSKSAFDNLLGGSSDVTVEVLEDTLDTSELEATLGADPEFGDISDGNDGGVDSDRGHSSDEVVEAEDKATEEETAKVTNSQKSINLSNLVSEDSLEQFVKVLEVELGQEVREMEIGGPEISFTQLEKLVETALTGLEDKPRQDHLKEDMKFLSQHGLRNVKVDLRNVSKEEQWGEEHKELVRWYKEGLGDKQVRKQKLLKGFSTIRDKFVIPDEERKIGGEDQRNKGKRNRVLDSSDSEMEVEGGRKNEEGEEKKYVTVEGEQATEERSERDNEDKNDTKEKKQGDRRNSSSSGNNNKDTVRKEVYRPGPIKSRKSQDKEGEEDRIQKKRDKKEREEERRIERHHSQGFKIPKVSTIVEPIDKPAVLTKSVSTPSPVGRSGVKSCYNAQGRYTQEKHRTEKFYQRQKFEKRINMNRVEQEAGNPDLGDIMNNMNKLGKEKKSKEESEDEQESELIKQVSERDRLRREEKERRERMKQGKETWPGSTQEDRKRNGSSEHGESDSEDDLPAPVPADLDDEDGGLPDPVPACVEDDYIEADDGGGFDDPVDDDVDMGGDKSFVGTNNTFSGSTVEIDNEPPPFSLFPAPVPAAPRRSLLGPPPGSPLKPGNPKHSLLGLPPGHPPLSVPPPPVWTPGYEPYSRRGSLLGSPPRPVTQHKNIQGRADREPEIGRSSSGLLSVPPPRRGPSTPVGEEPDTQSDSDGGNMAEIEAAIAEAEAATKVGPQYEVTAEKAPSLKSVLKKTSQQQISSSKAESSKIKIISSTSRTNRNSSCERSRTPSPFLSANRHYPWLYGETGEGGVDSGSDTGIQLDKIRIRDKKTSRKSREERKIHKEARMEAEARAALKAVRSQNEDYEPSEDVPLWEPSEEERKLQPPKVKGFKIDQTRSFLDTKNVSNVKDKQREKELADRLSGPHLGLFLDKVISSLQTKTQSAPLPPLPPGPPVPPPPPREPPPLPPEPHPDTPEPGELTDPPSKASSDINVGEADFDDSLISSIVSGLDPDLKEDEKLKKAKEKLANILIKKKQPQLKNGLSSSCVRPSLLPHPHPVPDTQYINTFMSDWGVEEKPAQSGTSYTTALAKLKSNKQRGAELTRGGYVSSHCGDRQDGNNGWREGKRRAGEDWPERQAKRFGREEDYHSSNWECWEGEWGQGRQGGWGRGRQYGGGGEVQHGGDVPHSGEEGRQPGREVERLWMEKFLVIWRNLLESDWSIIRSQGDREVQQKKLRLGTNQDLGSMFNEPVLNQRVVDKVLGEERAVFRSWDKLGILQLECTVCNITVSVMKVMQSHIMGKKHLKRLDEFTVLDGGSDCDPVKAMVDLVPNRSLLSSLLEKYMVGPVVGLEYVVEVLVGRADPEYRCALCRISSSIQDIMEHLLSANHRLAYMDKYFPQASKKFLVVPNKSLWTVSTFDFLDTVVNRIEAKFARAEPRVVASLMVWEREKLKISSEIEEGMHARECPGFSFENLPDPFRGNFSQIAPEAVLRN